MFLKLNISHRLNIFDWSKRFTMHPGIDRFRKFFVVKCSKIDRLHSRCAFLKSRSRNLCDDDILVPKKLKE